LAATIGLSASEADAHWGWRFWGCRPCYSVGCYSPCGGWYLGVRPGPIRRFLFGPYRWYYGGYCGYCCCSPCCCWDPCCCGDVVIHDGVMPSMPERAVPDPAMPGPDDGAPGASGPSGIRPQPLPEKSFTPPIDNGASGGVTDGASMLQVSTRSNSGLLTVYVPYEAKVWINGNLTSSAGSERRYVSYGLKPGYRYKYEVRARVPREGKMLEQVKTVYLTAGAKEGLAFGFNRPPTTETADK